MKERLKSYVELISEERQRNEVVVKDATDYVEDLLQENAIQEQEAKEYVEYIKHLKKFKEKLR